MVLHSSMKQHTWFDEIAYLASVLSCAQGPCMIMVRGGGVPGPILISQCHG